MNKIVALALGAAVGCSGGDSDVAAPEPRVEPPAAPRPGPAYFGVRDHGVVRLDGGRFELVVRSGFSVEDIAVAADGTVWVAASGAVYRITGDDAGMVGDRNSPGDMDRIAAGPGGTAWAVGHTGVARYDGAGWSIEARDAFGDDLLNDVAVDAEGRPWVVATHAVYARDDAASAWAPVDIGAGDPEHTFLREIEAGTDGALYVAGNRGVRVRRDGVWTEHALRAGYSGVSQVAVGPDGELRGLGGVSNLYMVSNGSTKPITAESGRFIASDVTDVQIDAAGRTWLGTDYGVVVLDRAGLMLQQWAPGTIPELPGTVDAIAVVGAGPSLPEVGEQALGSVRGRIASGGAGVAGATVELCESPAMMFKLSPCDTAVYRKRVRADGDGYFEAQRVPVGTYGFAIRASPDATWKITMGGDCCGRMNAGQVYDIGTLSIDR